MIKKTKIKLILFVALLPFIFLKPAHAYIDPGTGSYLFQLLAAGGLGSLFFFRTAFRKLKAFFKNSGAKKSSIENDENR
jgi:hypothetical protein